MKASGVLWGFWITGTLAILLILNCFSKNWNMRFFKNSKNRPTVIQTYSDPANILGKKMECMMASGIRPWILTTWNNWRSEVTGYPSDRRRLPASSGSNDYELLGDRQTAVINSGRGVCVIVWNTPLVSAPGSTAVADLRLGCQNWLQCAVGGGGEETRLPPKKRLVASLIWSSCSSNMVRVFLPQVSIDLDLVHSFFPFFVSLFFLFYLFIYF